MFPGMFMRKPDKAAALKQLKSHVAMFGAWVVVIRVTPYTNLSSNFSFSLFLARINFLTNVVGFSARQCDPDCHWKKTYVRNKEI
ncbi:Mitochondrial import receptor subunit TOM6-like protein, partial [Mucuna pruriens]